MRNALLSLSLLGLTAFSVQAARIVPQAPQVDAKAYVLMDFNSGKILAESNGDERLPPASLTKMMTSYIIGKEIKDGRIKRDDMVTVSNNAWAKNFPDSSKMFIEVGTQVSVGELNKGIIIDSGNDACVAMAEHIAGTVSGFADLMNAEAKQLGLKNTHFVNPHGLPDPEHYSTAHDMALLGAALIRDLPEEYKIYSDESFTYNGIKQFNRNALLHDKSMNVDGIKTGHVSEVGYSLVASGVKDGMRLVSAVIGTKSNAARRDISKELLNWGFRFYETVTPFKAGQEFAKQRIYMGDVDQVRLGVLDATPVTVPRGAASDIKADFQLDKELKAPLAKGERVGTLFLKLDDKDIAQYPLVALDEVKQGGWFSRLMDYLTLLVKGWFS
ncbi:D-alanyl-D-alanine carboxypeptidase family protein [Gallaecimonas pentaromativorans]|uniref:serine-type D-Ala-D-Ala carboxypeptidase n=2 Tax=Gallaecimonas pentaromativorans TaxID=584787 RepID=A0A3N1PN57_9GAMM|nr:D-alanyl-D-alanine carboxypeptidase family protein [Gallaecimonas pentaromativorans]MED5525195.1 D-alanyl-D-alanine carboxypeptidase family protein [Pseudomonadota bacterium]ROQ25966.1 penicillin-binding protein 6 [Gallaecimonas pentaromativorans]